MASVYVLPVREERMPVPRWRRRGSLVVIPVPRVEAGRCSRIVSVVQAVLSWFETWTEKSKPCDRGGFPARKTVSSSAR
jgi:hypothetical protein